MYKDFLTDFSTLDHIRNCQDKDCKNEFCISAKRKTTSEDEADAFFRSMGANL